MAGAAAAAAIGSSGASAGDDAAVPNAPLAAPAPVPAPAPALPAPVSEARMGPAAGGVAEAGVAVATASGSGGAIGAGGGDAAAVPDVPPPAPPLVPLAPAAVPAPVREAGRGPAADGVAEAGAEVVTAGSGGDSGAGEAAAVPSAPLTAPAPVPAPVPTPGPAPGPEAGTGPAAGGAPLCPLHLSLRQGSQGLEAGAALAAAVVSDAVGVAPNSGGADAGTGVGLQAGGRCRKAHEDEADQDRPPVADMDYMDVDAVDTAHVPTCAAGVQAERDAAGSLEGQPGAQRGVKPEPHERRMTGLVPASVVEPGTGSYHGAPKLEPGVFTSGVLKPGAIGSFTPGAPTPGISLEGSHPGQSTSSLSNPQVRAHCISLVDTVISRW